MAAAALSPSAAQAVGENTLYVNSGSAACTDEGSGAVDAPYCSLQAAFDAVGPGDVVNIVRGTYAPATLSRSGTADSPIIVTGRAALGSYTVSGPTPLTLAGASNVEVEGLQIYSGTAAGIVVDGGSDVLLTNVQSVLNSDVSDPVAVHITGGASGVTVRDDESEGSMIVDGGSTGTVLTTNLFNNIRGVPITVDDASNTAITSNTIANCGPGIDVVDTSTGTRIENNIVSTDIEADCSADAQQPFGIEVDSSSAASTTADYNDVYTGSAGAPYSWGGTSYATAASLYTAANQGRHDDNSQAGSYLGEKSPAIDSADSAAVGEQTTDLFGEPRVHDPLVSPSGPGPHNDYDRGAQEFQDPYVATSSSRFTAAATTVPTGTPLNVTATLSDTWGDSFSSYEFSATNGAITPVISSSGSASLSFAAPGDYMVWVDVEPAGSATYVNLGVPGVTVHVVAPQPLTVGTSVLATSARTAQISDATTDGWNITGYTFDFGDGTPAVHPAAADLPLVHTYAHAGTYTITETVTDAAGNTASKATKFTTPGSDYIPYGPTRILDTRHGTGAAEAKVAVGHSVVLKIAGNGSIPAGVTAVALNVTATDTVGNGYVSVEPDGTSAASSNLNYLAGQTQTNYVIVPVAADGKIDLYDLGPAGGSVDLIADVSGYFTQATGTGYTPVTPARILDTRHGTGAPAKQVGPSAGLSVAIAGADSIPTGVTAVAVHVTVTDTTGNGWIAAEADGAGTPTTSILNYLKGQTVSNTVIVPVASDGKIELYNGGGPGSVDLIADVAGYFSAGSTESYIPLTPYRAWDSRRQGSPLLPDNAASYPLGIAAPEYVPGNVTLVANLTVTDVTANGYISAYATGTSRPGISNLNYSQGQTVAGLSLLAGTGDALSVSIYNQSTGTGDLIADVFGYFSK